MKFIEDEENYIKKLAAPKKPKTEKEKQLDKQKEKEREAKKKAYLERKALQLEQNRKKAEENRMYNLFLPIIIKFIRLRQIQEEEYKEAEKIMKEQEEFKKIEEEFKKIEEETRIQKENEEKHQKELEIELKKQKMREMGPEPEINENNLISILFRLPDGSKITRRFRLSENIQVKFRKNVEILINLKVFV